MATVDIFFARGNMRSRTIADAAFVGLRNIGDTPRMYDSREYRGVRADYAVFYGLSCGLDTIFKEYRENATAIYVDLGYWRRRISGRYDGYHKMTINSRHPTEYFQNRKHDPLRFKALGVPLQAWKPRPKHGKILLAGMSEKASHAERIAHQSWERKALEAIRQHSRIPVIYRPKPSCKRSQPIQGAGFDKVSPLAGVFKNCHAVVTRQSNTAIDGLLAGVPVFCEYGAASVLGLSDLSLIETPSYPDGRQQWAEDIAWCQFTPGEIATGLPFKHFKDEGLIP